MLARPSTPQILGIISKNICHNISRDVKILHAIALDRSLSVSLMSSSSIATILLASYSAKLSFLILLLIPSTVSSSSIS